MNDTRTLTLADFLNARIEDDEACAIRLDCGCGEGVSEVDPLPNCPDRIAAECEAKRALITVLSDVEWSGSYAVRDVTLGIMAAVYADHPDFREEWRA